MEDFFAIKNKIFQIVDFDFFDRAVLSNPLKRGDGICFKIISSKFSIKNNPVFQFSFFIDKKVVHENIEIFKSDGKYDYSPFVEKLFSLMRENFKQCNIFANKTVSVLMNKKRLFKIVENKENKCASIKENSHNVEKNYIIKDGVFSDWLFETGIMDKNGKVHNSMQKKFRQINRFVEMIADVEQYIPNNALIVDMGCGKSYLTFAVYYYLNVIKNKHVKIKGFDLKKDVVQKCGRIAEKSGFHNLSFFAGDISDLEVNSEKADMLITLHACDTATDFAIAYAVKQGCEVIMSVPCCQHELFGQVENNVLKNIISYGIFKERFSAVLTDGIRAETLRLCGYNVSVLEFIDMEHTPKNIMIRAVKKNNYRNSQKNIEEYQRLLESFNVNPTIYTLLKDYFVL